MVEAWVETAGWLLPALGLWVAFAIVSGAIGAVKGRPGLGSLLGLLLGPVGLAITLAMRGTLRECPYCSGLIPRVAPACSHCGKHLRG